MFLEYIIKLSPYQDIIHDEVTFHIATAYPRFATSSGLPFPQLKRQNKANILCST